MPIAINRDIADIIYISLCYISHIMFSISERAVTFAPTPPNIFNPSPKPRQSNMAKRTYIQTRSRPIRFEGFEVNGNSESFVYSAQGHVCCGVYSICILIYIYILMATVLRLFFIM